jgi:hypothetical protein
MAIKVGGNMIVGGVSISSPPPVPEPDPVPVRKSLSRILTENKLEEQTETHVKLTDGELERLVPKKSSYMMDLALGS